MEQLTKVWVEFTKIAKVNENGAEEPNCTYGLYIYNETHSDYVFGFEWDELKNMSSKDVLQEIQNVREKYLYECVLRRNGFYLNENWVLLDELK